MIDTVYYLVGTPKARLKKFEADLLGQPWKSVREGVDVKLQSQDGELYVFAQSRDRVAKEAVLAPIRRLAAASVERVLKVQEKEGSW